MGWAAMSPQVLESGVCADGLCLCWNHFLQPLVAGEGGTLAAWDDPRLLELSDLDLFALTLNCLSLFRLFSLPRPRSSPRKLEYPVRCLILYPFSLFMIPHSLQAYLPVVSRWDPPL